ncbi:MAG: metalloprotease TldD [Gammaproteobacteria bacterium]|jgi:TldD protein|nr:metalloprotease TldD [Gammaproteobacteria bacterium]MDH3863542.1 metalloprotease TldD [Gammaproteobacteria bacterium]MDH3904433.1 metalloprotease TldD [Gammaproteobacteria bacterium]MDH3908801.1 metalloprotease TldD [Gammaproteobacteria bacterium]MDH3953362.1 metalloprotease TldD [Gammaproteobacteria bacterium]
MADMLAPAGLEERHLSRTLGSILRGGVDYADLYFQVSRQESWTLEDGIIREGSFNLDQGVGVRAVSGEKTGLAYSDELMLPALERAAGAARAIARQGESKQVPAWQRGDVAPLYPVADPTRSIPDVEKTALITRIDAATRALDSRVEQVIISMTSNQDLVLVAGSDGTLAADVRPLVRFNVSVILEQDGRREQGYAGGGARSDLNYFLAGDRPLDYAREAVRQATVALEAVPAPAGTMPVVLGPGWPGILLHEAVGHGLEGDFNRKGTSAFSGKIGQRVAAPHCTIVDDGTLVNRRGSLAIDDEGTPGQYNVLVEDGVLKGYMQDKLNARLMGVAATGNGRRESYAHMPMPRMTNTYMLAGPHEHQEIIASVKQGLYAPNFGGGQVDITSGKFVFSASEAYLIENGTITAPVKGAMLIGDGPDALTKISMVGNDLQLDSGVGTCGKEGQSVPVGVGQPTLKIDELTVGGTA